MATPLRHSTAFSYRKGADLLQASANDDRREYGIFYNYKAVLQRALEGLEAPFREIVRPEIYPSGAQVMDDAARRWGSVHFALKEPYLARVHRGMRNVLAFDWPLNVLPPREAFADRPGLMVVLKAFDGWIVPSAFAARVLAAHGLKATVAAPVVGWEAGMPALARAADRPTFRLALDPIRLERVDADVLPDVELKITTAAGFRSFAEDLYGVVRGFAEAEAEAEAERPANLVIHVHGADGATPDELAQWLRLVMPAGIKNAPGRIYLVQADRPFDALAAAMEGAGAFVCASRSCAFDLGAAMAVARGVTLLSPAHTGLADLVSERTALVLGSYETHSSPGFWHEFSHPDLRTNFLVVDSVAAQIKRLKAAPAPVLKALAGRGREHLAVLEAQAVEAVRAIVAAPAAAEPATEPAGARRVE